MSIPLFCSSWKKTDQDHAAIVPPALFGQKLTRKLGTLNVWESIGVCFDELLNSGIYHIYG